MKIFQIIGQPGSGKTTLVAEIVTELCRRDIRVGTIKHTAHAHELDKPGKDSFIHRTAGAAPAAMMTRDMAAVYLPRTPGMTPADLIDTWYAHLDIVLIEGWLSGPYEKIEVWRACVNRPALFPDIDRVKALVTDDRLDDAVVQQADTRGIACLKRSGLSELVALITG